MLQLFLGSGDDDTHEIVDIDFEGIQETHICRGEQELVEFLGPRYMLGTPKTILDVPLRHENLVVVIGFGKGMNDSTKGMAQLIQGFLAVPFLWWRR